MQWMDIKTKLEIRKEVLTALDFDMAKLSVHREVLQIHWA